MPTEEELLSAIDAAPDADAPRLAHADWLEDQGKHVHAARLRAAPPRCRLVLAGEVEAKQREALAAILGERLRLE